MTVILTLVYFSTLPAALSPLLVGLALAAGVLTGIPLSLWSWRREIVRVESGRPMWTFSWRNWWLWSLFGIAVPLVAVALYLFFLRADTPIPESLSIAAVSVWFWVETVLAVTLAHRLFGIPRYEKRTNTKLILVSSGNSSWDVREILVLKDRTTA